MKRPILIDLFCCQGGAAMGYHRAGFDVIGVDINPQPRYPFRFVQADALAFLDRMIAGGTWGDIDPSNIAAVHASTPCQGYIRSGMVAKDGRHPRLIPQVRELLTGLGLLAVLENVPGAPLRPDLMLCGSMFGLAVRRHRLFELTVPISPLTPPCDHSRPITGVYGHPHGAGGAWRNGKRPMLPSDVPTWSWAMGIDWMDAKGLAEAIPPAYTEFIGDRLLTALEVAA